MLSILGEKRMASWYIYSSRGPVSVTCSSARAPANLISLGLHTKTQPPVSVALPLSSDCHHTAVSSPKAENCPAHTWLFTCGSVMSLDSLWYIWEGEAAGEWTGQGSGRRGWLGGVHWASSVAYGELDVWRRCEDCHLGTSRVWIREWDCEEACDRNIISDLWESLTRGMKSKKMGGNGWSRNCGTK